MMLRIAFLILALLPGAARQAAAEAPPRDSGGLAAVAEILDGDTLVLDDGRRVRLVGIQAPKRPPELPEGTPWPLDEAARAALGELTRGWLVELRYGGARMDRHNRLLAHLVRIDGTWVQGEMLRRGLARVDSLPESRASVPEMLALERAARAAGRGLWREPRYAVREAGDALPSDGFHLVEGRVLRATRTQDQLFLDFGPDWHSDFSVRIARSALPLFREARLDPLALEGATVRVRGWLRRQNGPLLDATHPEQIEVLHRPRAGAAAAE